jgi:membrane protein DedA with SNARE-associated domain
VTSWLAHYGVFAVFILMMIDAVFPAASELVMLYGGALASGALTHSVDILGWHTTGFTAYLAVVAAGVLGYQIGAIIGWWIGERGGRPFLERHGRLVHLTHERLERAERWFERWNDWAVLVGRVTPIARSFISIPAGVFGMPFKRYNVLTLIGNTAWCAVIAGIGYGLGSSYESFNHGFKYVEYAVVLLIVAAVGYLVLRRRRATVSR